MDVVFPVVGVQFLIKLLGLMILAKISLHITVGLIWLRCLYKKKGMSDWGVKFQTYCHVSISLFMSTHISLSLNEILLALSIT